MRVLDLFAGIGGFTKAGELVGGFDTRQFVEIDPYCQSVLKKHWDIPIHSDVKTFKAERGEYHLITAGFPCQDLSVAGRERGLKPGTRSALFYEVIRLLRDIRPRFLLLENVRNLLSHQEGKTFQEILFQIARCGYDAEWKVVSASDIRGCHKRERIFIIAYPKHYGLSPTKRCEGDEQFSKAATWKEETFKSKGSSQSNSCSNVQRTTDEWKPTRALLDPDWRTFSVKPTISRTDVGISSGSHKSRIIALGNCVIPQCAAVPLARIKQLDEAYSPTT